VENQMEWVPGRVKDGCITGGYCVVVECGARGHWGDVKGVAVGSSSGEDRCDYGIRGEVFCVGFGSSRELQYCEGGPVGRGAERVRLVISSKVLKRPSLF
jgi:hypothetical protein